MYLQKSNPSPSVCDKNKVSQSIWAHGGPPVGLTAMHLHVDALCVSDWRLRHEIVAPTHEGLLLESV